MKMTLEEKIKIAKLNRYKSLNIAIETNILELEKWRSIAESISPTTGENFNGGGKKDKCGNSVAMIIDIENTIEQEIKDLIEERKVIKKAIESVEQDFYKNILTQKYLLNLTFEQIAVNNFISYRHLCRLHLKAIDEVNI